MLSNEIKKSIKLVYYVYIDRQSNWLAIVSGQLSQLKSYGLLDEAELYVHITDMANIFTDVIEVVQRISINAIISRSVENYFEYNSLSLIYDLAKQHPDCFLLYLHTKGMSYHLKSRLVEEIALLTKTFENWRENLELFNDEKINKIGLFPAVEEEETKLKQGIIGGWIWFNFWYARGSYLVSCGQPELNRDRYYFEEWLGGLQKDHLTLNNDCHNLYNIKGQKYFTAFEASKRLIYLSNSMR